MEYVIGLLFIVGMNWWNNKTTPLCSWCQCHHHGRCIYNPRSGRIMANVNDGYFDYYDPNK